MKPPQLDGDAARVQLKAPPSHSIPVKTLEKWESKARMLVAVASHADIFSASTDALLSEQSISPLVLRRLMEALAKTTRYSIALSLSLASELLRARRDSCLAANNRMLMPHSKGILRTAPLKSSSLFGGLIKDVAETDWIDQTHMALSVNQKGFKNLKIPGLNPSGKPKFTGNRGRRPYRNSRVGPHTSVNLPLLQKANP